MILPREIRRWGWYRNSKMVHMLIHLLLEAQYQDSSYMGMKIKRGQLVTGRKQLAIETGMSEREVRTCLERLTDDQQIVIQTTNKFSVITICNYDSWQGVQSQNDQQTTNKKPENDQQNDQQNGHIQINKEIKQKDLFEEKDTNVSKKKKIELDFSIIAPEFVETINMWLQYKKERGESYKPTGFKQMYKKLTELSNNRPEVARKIVEQSMANNYSGLFPLNKKDEVVIPQKTNSGPQYNKFNEWVNDNCQYLRSYDPLQSEDEFEEVLKLLGGKDAIMYNMCQVNNYACSGRCRTTSGRLYSVIKEYCSAS